MRSHHDDARWSGGLSNTFISTVFANCHEQYCLGITNCPFFIRLPVIFDRQVQVFSKPLPAGEQYLIGTV